MKEDIPSNCRNVKYYFSRSLRTSIIIYRIALYDVLMSEFNMNKKDIRLFFNVSITTLYLISKKKNKLKVDTIYYQKVYNELTILINKINNE